MPGGAPRIRILLDQNAPLGLRRLLSGHEVVAAAVLAVIETATPGSYATIRFPKPPRRRRPYPALNAGAAARSARRPW